MNKKTLKTLPYRKPDADDSASFLPGLLCESLTFEGSDITEGYSEDDLTW